MKVLLVSLNRYRSPMPVMPVGACLVADAAARAGHGVRFLDLMFSRNPEQDLRDAVSREPPDIVGLSLRNLDNNHLADPVEFASGFARAVQTVRSASRAPIVAGGAALGVMPEPLLRLSGTDLAVLGDGDVVFPKVLASLANGGNGRDVPGTAWMDNGGFHCNPGFDGHPLDGMCAPRFRHWIDVEAYLRMMCPAGLQTGRGCEFECVYCTYALAEGSAYRFHPVDSVIEGTRELVQTGIRDIDIVDSVFNAPYEHALSICEAFAGAGTGARLQTLELNPGFVDARLLSMMERAGFVGIGITAESASDAVLESLGKGYRSGEVRRAAEAVAGSPLPCAWMFMLGGPGETKETVRETLRFVSERIRASDVVYLSVGVRIYPGTQLEKIARDEGVLSEGADMLRPVFYFSPRLDPGWLERELDRYLADHMNAVGQKSIRLPFLPFIQRMGYRFGVRPPLWKHTRRIRRILSALGVRA